MLTSHLGFKQSAGKGGAAARTQPAPGLWISCSPLPQFPPQGEGEQRGAGVCLHVLLLVGVLIGSSWGAAPPPASAAIPPVLPARQCQAPPPLSVHTPPRFIPPSSLLPLPSLSCCCRSSSPRGRPASCPLNPALRAHPNLLLPQPFQSQLLRPKLDFRLDSSLLSHLS